MATARHDSAVDGDDHEAESDPLATAKRPHHTIVVGIGASAGGLSALKVLLETIPRETGLAFVIVVHLSADRRSHLADLLQPFSRIPVSQVTDDAAIEPNRVYVIPPGRNLSAVDSHLRLAPPDEGPGARAPVDHFFRTMAETYDGSSVGVILTGTGSDGARGIRYVREHGGMTIAQDPDEAEFDGMPRSAIGTGVVDRVLRLGEIIGQIIEFSTTTPDIPDARRSGEAAPEKPADELEHVLTVVRVRTGHDFLRYKRSTLERRIARRMQVLKLMKLTDYLDVLNGNDTEVAALLDDLLINVTSFFRDSLVFRALQQDVIPELFAGKGRGDTVRVWSVGCATGEEAYSLGMLLLEEAAREPDAPRVQVFATDLHERSLQKGRDALYGEMLDAEITPERLERFFKKESGGYRVVKELRDVVVFAAHNVLRDPPFSKLDLIVCRNLLIYLQRDVQGDVIEVFHYALRSGGRLVLGTAETLTHSEWFRSEHDKQAHIYRRRDLPRAAMRVPMLTVGGPIVRRHRPDLPGAASQTASRERGVAAVHQQLLQQHSPPSVLVAPDNKIAYLSEGVGRYFEHQRGEPSSELLKVVREEFRLELHSALLVVRERRTAWRSRPIATTVNGKPRWVVVHVYPSDDLDLEGFALVAFEETHAPAGVDTLQVDLPDQPSREHETELGVTQGRTRALIDEFEATQDEMRASNEELQSSNEELRSTLEELETSREELQSVNEELQTLNQENRLKVEELTQLSSDLQNLLQATDVATLFLDRHLRILRFTPRVSEIFNVRHTDRGRPLADLTHRLGYPRLMDDARRVLQTLVPAETDVQTTTGDAHFLLRTAPYRTIDDRIEGLVITLIDVTALKRTEAELRLAEERQNFLLQLQDAMRVLAQPGAIEQASARMLGAHLGASRVVFTVVNDDQLIVSAVYPGSPTHERPLLSLDAGGHVEAACRQALDVVVNNVHTEARFSAADQASFASADIASFVVDTMITTDGCIHALVIEQRTPFTWTRSQLVLIRDAFERTMEMCERARIAIRLRTVQERHHLIIEGARDYAIISLDSAGTIQSWSAGAEAVFGWPAADAIGRSIAMTFTPEDLANGECEKELAGARANGHAPDVRWHVRRDGSRVFIDGVTRVLTTDDPGELGFLKVGQDVTQRLELEESLRDLNRSLEERVAERTRQIIATGEALRHSDARFRALFDSVDEGFCIVDVIFDKRLRAVDYRFVEANPAFERLTGFNAPIGRTVRELTPRQEPSWFEVFGRIALSGQSERVERPAESLGGWYDMFAFRVGEAADRRVAVLFSDISGRKHTEAERESLRARLQQAEEDERRRLARELHDEVSQHLTALGLGLKALSDVAPPGSEIDQRAAELRVVADTLGRELHALAVRLRPKVLDDFGLGAALSSYVAEWARRTNIAVELHAPSEAARLPDAVESAIYRIAQEALTNVLRHAAATQVSVVVERHAGHVLLVVEDNGRGFDLAMAQGPASSGLGLRGVRERVALLRGTLAVETGVGTGTTIFVRVPIPEMVKDRSASPTDGPNGTGDA